MVRDLKNIQDQINAQMYWDASEKEIAEWLSDKFGIVGDEAKAMILKGINNKKSEIRKTSLIRMIVALLVAIPLAVIAIIGLKSDGKLGARGIFIAVVCVACLSYAGKNLLQLISGRSDTAIDS